MVTAGAEWSGSRRIVRPLASRRYSEMPSTVRMWVKQAGASVASVAAKAATEPSELSETRTVRTYRANSMDLIMTMDFPNETRQAIGGTSWADDMKRALNIVAEAGVEPARGLPPNGF